MKQYRTKLGNSEIGKKKKKTKESNWKPRNVFTSPSWKKKNPNLRSRPNRNKFNTRGG